MEFHKLDLAANMLAEATREYWRATDDMGLIKSILLAGAAINIIAPLIPELDPSKAASHESVGTLAVDLAVVESLSSIPEPAPTKSEFIAFARSTYNGLKHAGKGRGKDRVAPSGDLILEADLKEDARDLIGDAIDDFRTLLAINHEIVRKFIPPPALRELLAVRWTGEVGPGESAVVLRSCQAE